MPALQQAPVPARALQAGLGAAAQGSARRGAGRGNSARQASLGLGESTEQSGLTSVPDAASADEIVVGASDFEDKGLRAGVLEKALTAFRVAVGAGQTSSMVFTVIDYELPSKEKRMWVINLATGKLLFHEHVAHGKGSDLDGDGKVNRVGNGNGDGTSNVGLLKTAETYTGKHGKSLRLDGLERGFNDQARERAVVVHSADYVEEDFIEANGRTGRSLGCPALDPDVNGKVIETIKGGSLIFAYWPDPEWLKKSKYLHPTNS